MYNIPFYKLNPSGNLTLLFEGLHHPKDKQNLFASKGLINLGGEQAGFVDVDKGILQMAGGEFCINATRSLALLMAFKHANPKEILPLQTGFSSTGSIKTSGFDRPLSFTVRALDANSDAYDVALNIPFEHMPPMQELDLGINLVSLPGIKHVLIHENYYKFDALNWQENSAKIRQKYQLEAEDAVGCIWWKNSPEDAKKIYSQPVVWVKEPHALHYENSCGSGSLALALWHYAQFLQQSFIMVQPGGNLTIELYKDIQGIMGTIGGPVSIMAQGTAYFS